MAKASTDCKGPGLVIPVIDRNRCESKSDCVRVCPYRVFQLDKLTPQRKGELTLRGRVKAWAHGNVQAVVVNPAACENCGLCVAACPERAITLSAARPPPA